MQSDLLLLLLTASLKKTLQTLKSKKKSEAGTSFVRYSGNTSVFSQIKSPEIRSDPGNDSVKALKF